MVFAPAPQLTITVEQVSDEPELHLHVGGQGIWQARMIASLGIPATMCTVLGGEVGRHGLGTGRADAIAELSRRVPLEPT